MVNAWGEIYYSTRISSFWVLGCIDRSLMVISLVTPNKKKDNASSQRRRQSKLKPRQRLRLKHTRPGHDIVELLQSDTSTQSSTTVTLEDHVFQ